MNTEPFNILQTNNYVSDNHKLSVVELAPLYINYLCYLIQQHIYILFKWKRVQ